MLFSEVLRDHLAITDSPKNGDIWLVRTADGRVAYVYGECSYPQSPQFPRVVFINVRTNVIGGVAIHSKLEYNRLNVTVLNKNHSKVKKMFESACRKYVGTRKVVLNEMMQNAN